MKELRNHNTPKVSVILILVGLMIIATPVLEPTVLAQSPVTTPSWTSTGTLNTRRYAHTATLLPNGKVMVAGGAGPDSCFTPTSSAEIYDPVSGTWSDTGSLNTARVNHTATLLQNGQVLVAGGGVNHYAPIDFINSAELYDPATGMWRPTGSFKTIRALDSSFSHGSTTLLPNGKVLALGASEPFHGVNSAELYDPATGTWSSAGTTSVGEHAVLLSNGKVLAVSGSSAKLYDPSTEQWSTTGNLHVFAETVTLLQNSKVLATGGQSAELYDPNTGTWSSTGNLNTSHSGGYGGYLATTLADGRVLVTGKGYSFDQPVSAEELYDPTAGTWSFTSRLMPSRLFHTATLLQNGKVLVAGGMEGILDGCDVFIHSTSELYDPSISSTTNSIDDPQFFVRQHYLDFLNREPDAAGLAFWTDNITKCSDPARRPVAQTEAECIDKQRVTTSASFFLSPEFQYTGYFVYRLYKGSLIQNGAGRVPTYQEFLRDVRQVASGIIQNNQLSATAIEANKKTFAEQFTQRPEFRSLYDPLSNFDYVERLFQTTGINVSAQEKQTLVDGLNNQTETRASVLQKVVDGTVVIAEGNQQFTTPYGQAFYQKEFNAAFVLMEYFGYLQRDPDAPGYQHWLDKLNSYGNYLDAEMVRSFIVSPEYRARFGQP